jgi:hypothetical protein
MHISTHKDSKKSSFAILWFFYYLLWFIEGLADLGEKEKEETITDKHFALWSFLESTRNEQVLLVTNHVSHCFCT